MKKQVFLRGLIGVPIGVTVSHVISIVTSFVWGDGSYSPCAPALTEQWGGELRAVLFQTALCAVLGAAFGAASAIWKMDHWSLLKQTGIYFLILSAAMFPIAYLTHWMEHTPLGFLLYFVIFVCIFFIVWMVQYFVWKQTIKKISGRIQNRESAGSEPRESN